MNRVIDSSVESEAYKLLLHHVIDLQLSGRLKIPLYNETINFLNGRNGMQSWERQQVYGILQSYTNELRRENRISSDTYRSVLEFLNRTYHRNGTDPAEEKERAKKKLDRLCQNGFVSKKVRKVAQQLLEIELSI